MEFFNKWAPIFMERLQGDFKLSLLSSAAVIGNAGHESGGFKSLQELKPIVKGSRGGFGIMQWTGPRRRDYEAYCERNHLDPRNMDANYKFLFVELTGPEGRVLPKLEAAKTLEEKVEIFSKGFLRPGIPHMKSRQEWAKKALRAWEISGKGISTPEPDEIEVPKKPKSIWQIFMELFNALFR